MSYITPVMDRDAANLAAKNSKAYFNIADWNRIYANVLWVEYELSQVFGLTFVFTSLPTPTKSDIPTIVNFNYLLYMIKTMRAALVGAGVGAVIAPVTTQTWAAGADKQAPNYVDVNQWESVIDQMHYFANHYP